jgi:hypothetical protein
MPATEVRFGARFAETTAQSLPWGRESCGFADKPGAHLDVRACWRLNQRAVEQSVEPDEQRQPGWTPLAG